jgi:hypothetical protein
VGGILRAPVRRIALRLGIARVDTVLCAAVVRAHAADAILAAAPEGALLGLGAGVVGSAGLAIRGGEGLRRDGVGEEEDGYQEHEQPQAMSGWGRPCPGLGHVEANEEEKELSTMAVTKGARSTTV